jgi:hypothetical protein
LEDSKINLNLQQKEWGKQKKRKKRARIFKKTVGICGQPTKGKEKRTNQIKMAIAQILNPLSRLLSTETITQEKKTFREKLLFPTRLKSGKPTRMQNTFLTFHDASRSSSENYAFSYYGTFT